MNQLPLPLSHGLCHLTWIMKRFGPVLFGCGMNWLTLCVTHWRRVICVLWIIIVGNMLTFPTSTPCLHGVIQCCFASVRVRNAHAYWVYILLYLAQVHLALPPIFRPPRPTLIGIHGQFHFTGTHDNTSAAAATAGRARASLEIAKYPTGVNV